MAAGAELCLMGSRAAVYHALTGGIKSTFHYSCAAFCHGCWLRGCRGLEGLRAQEVHVAGEDLGTSDYALVNLEGCTVFLLGTLSALHVRKVKNCKIVAAAVTGATLLEGEA